MNAPATEAWIIEGACVVDPAAGTAGVRDLFIQDGRFADRPHPRAQRIRAAGCLALPGAFDLHVHTREPGDTGAETVASAGRAAAAGGFTAFVAMPNTVPATDTPAIVRQVLALARAADCVDLYPSAALTRNREGLLLTDMAALKAAGAAAFTDDGATPADPAVMRAAMQMAATLDLPVLDHAMIGPIAGHGQIREPAASRLGLPAIPAASEIAAVGRDIDLVRETGGRLHIQHISTAEGVELVRRARADRLPVTAEATPHHLALSTTDIVRDDADFKMNPPLGTDEDRAALIRGVLDGSITTLATDHAPHRYPPGTPIAKGAFGIIGLETALPLTYDSLVRRHGLSPQQWVALWTAGPRAVLRLPRPALNPGAAADVTVFAPDETWVVDPAAFQSASRNTPFAGHTLTGRVRLTLRHGRVIHMAP